MAIHLIPLLIYKRKELKENPKKVILSYLKGVFSSTLFFAAYVAIFRYLVCFLKNIRGKMDTKNILLAGTLAIAPYPLEPLQRRFDIGSFFF